MSAESTVNVLKQRLEKALLKKDELGEEESPVTESVRDCLERLDQVDMTLQVLTDTLIGATVVKFKANPVFGPTCKQLVKKWKGIAKQSGVTNKKPAPKSKQAVQKQQRRDSSDEISSELKENWADLPPLRQKICAKLFPLLRLAKALLVQAGMAEEAVDSCLARTAVEIENALDHQFANDRKSYSDKARSLAFNLKNNLQLSQDLVYGVVTADDLTHMTAEQLASADQRKERAEHAKKLSDSKRLDWDQANEAKINEMCGIKGDLLKASLFTCGRCKSVKTTSTQKQTRSADEPMTVFVLCINCGNRWKC